MNSQTVNNKYYLFVNSLLLVFLVVINTIKGVSDLVLLLLAIPGLWFAVSQGSLFFRVKELRLLSLVTLLYFTVVCISIIFSGKASELAHFASRELYFLFAPFIGLALYKAKLNLNYLWFGIKLALIIFGTISWYGFFSDLPRFAGRMNPNVFGDLAVMMLLFLVVHLTLGKTLKTGLFSLLALLGGVSTVILSENRGALVLLLVFSVFYLPWVYSFFKPTLKIKLATLVVMTLIWGIIFSLPVVQDRVATAGSDIRQLLETGDGHTSVGIRLKMWAAAIKAVPDMPFLTGHGYRNTIPAVVRHINQADGAFISNFNHLHNIYIDHLLDRGLLGIISLFGILVLPFIFFIKNLKKAGDYCEASILGLVLVTSYAVLGLTHRAFGTVFMNAFFVFFLSVILISMASGGQSYRALAHYRFGPIFAWFKRKLSKRSQYISIVKDMYDGMGLENNSCSLCGYNNYSLLCTGDRYGFDLRKQICNQCGLVQTHPAPSEEFHQEFYTNHYHKLYTGGVEKTDYAALVYDQLDKGDALVEYLKKNDLSENISQLNVIEIGCSTGGIINNLKPHVRSVQGCDLDVGAIRYARENFNLNVEVSTYPTLLPLGPRLFVLSHVLEHMYKPLDVLGKIRTLMDAGDYLYVAVPGLNQVAAGDYKHDLRRYFHIAHVTDFTASTLSSMMGEAGLKAVHVNEKIDGLFVLSSSGKIKWKRAAADSIDNIRFIESTYKKWFFHS